MDVKVPLPGTSIVVTNFKVKVRIVPVSYQDLTEGKPDYFSPFRPGMTATVDVITEKRENIIGVPISAIVVKLPSDTISKNKSKVKKITTADEEKFEAVFVKNGEKAELRIVTTGIQDDSNIEITSGLTENDIVITGPYNLVTKKLKSGDKVEEESSESNNKEESED